jgi:lysozyme family protein
MFWKWRVGSATIRTILAARPTSGITLAVYADWKGVAPDAALKEELQGITTFDTAVNHGVTGAIRLQQAVGTDIDGEMGPLTLGAVARLAVADALRAYAESRRARYRALPHFWRFGRGWLARVDTTLSRALAIAAEAPSAAVPKLLPHNRKDLPS